MGAPSGPGLTDEQRRAVETRDVSIALSAGAGCGKTHVLVERYLAHLTPGTNGDIAAPLAGLIAITFTDRAAREMRDRVRRTCRDRLQAAQGDDEAERWLALLRELETARISTIHAFCGSLLRAHAVEAGIDPRFQILQPSQSATIFAEQMDDQLRQLLAARNADLMDLVVEFGMNRLTDMMQHLLGRRHAIDFAKWRDLTPDELVERWRTVERERVFPAVRGEFLASDDVKALRKILSGWTPENTVMRARFAALAGAFQDLEGEGELLATLAIVRENARIQGGGSAKQWHSPEVHAEFRDAAERTRKWIDAKLSRLGIAPATARASAAAGLKLLRVAEPIIGAYEGRKRTLGMLDFNDLMIGARALLVGAHGDRLRRQLSSRLVLLLVDEFQDTDPLQVELVEILCGDAVYSGKLFFVGDAKQSIYRFRGADPRVFRNLRARIPSAGRLPLTQNFRSQPEILSFVNALFCERLGPQYEPLVPHRQPLAERPAIEFLWATPTEADEKQTADALRRREADWIARRLATLFAEAQVRIFDKQTKTTRPALPGDTAILFRALSDVQHYEAALRRHGIPYYLVGGAAFYAQQEIFDLLNLLRALDLPSDEISLTGVLRSPFFSLMDETLFWLAQHPRGLAAGLASGTLPAEIDEAQARRVRFAAATLRALRAEKDRVPIATLIRRAFALTGYDATIVAEFLGERKLANLNKLIDQARSFDAAGIFTLADFIHQLSEFVSSQPDEAPAPVEIESSTVVRLMTIHQAKGLEFPVVVVPDLGRVLGGARGSVAFDPELGPLVRARPGRGEDEGACGLDLYRALEQAEEADEEIRLFYVAATRAADHLILSAGLQKIDEAKGSWLNLLGERFDLQTGALRATLPAGYSTPRVAVTLAEPAAIRQPASQPQRGDIDALLADVRAQAASGRTQPNPLVQPVLADPGARRVFSFSRLKAGLELTEPTDFERPERLDDLGVDDATRLGTLVHAVMAQIEFDAKVDVAERFRRARARQAATSAATVDAGIALVARFLASPRAADLRAATTVHRELEFLLAWPLTKVPDGLMIQGFLDCLYQDQAGEWHVVDFKTNRVTAAAAPQAALGYEMQMHLYALAVEEILGKRPASLVLYFLQPGVECTIPWDDATRRTAIEQIDRTLKKARGEG